MITFEYIEQEYNKAPEHAYGLIPSRNWSSLPMSLVLTVSPRKLGIANESTGEGSINSRYRNTTAYTSLRNTIFLELAHFCVGTHNNHNKVFKRVLSRFTDHFEVDKSELEQLIKQVDSNSDYLGLKLFHFGNVLCQLTDINKVLSSNCPLLH